MTKSKEGVGMEAFPRMLEVCKDIQKDMEADAMALDGKPFTGKTMAVELGHLYAAVKALSGIVEKIVEAELSSWLSNMDISDMMDHADKCLVDRHMTAQAKISELVSALKWYADDKNWDQETGVCRELIRQPNTVDGPGETIEEADMGYCAEQAISRHEAKESA